jgi:crotonobetainyl-CoA:carnitine CoA-transferase CaiB-like acyl-CoA transferase
VQCIEPQFYALFLTVMDLGADDDFARPYDTSQWPKACARLIEMFAQHPQDHWAALFDGTDACVAPVLSPDRAAMHPHVAARGIWENTDGILSAAPAPRFSNYDAPHGQIPHRDGDRDAILAWAAAAKGR